MPSVVTRDDVQDVLYGLGIKNPAAIAKATRAIDFYSMNMARQYAVPLMPAAPQVKPGDSDQDAKITRCFECEKIKAWSQFPYDPKSDTKHSAVCKDCSPNTQVPRDPELELECASCGLSKNADSNFRRSSSISGYRASCKDCESGRRRCVSCEKIRFPREYIGSSKSCVFCMAEKYVSRSKKRVKVAA